jgi:hypothetical protein
MEVAVLHYVCKSCGARFAHNLQIQQGVHRVQRVRLPARRATVEKVFAKNM